VRFLEKAPKNIDYSLGNNIRPSIDKKNNTVLTKIPAIVGAPLELTNDIKRPKNLSRISVVSGLAKMKNTNALYKLYFTFNIKRL
jgi:hypothetical protein